MKATPTRQVTRHSSILTDAVLVAEWPTGPQIRPTNMEIDVDDDVVITVTLSGPRQMPAHRGGGDARDRGTVVYDLTDNDVTLPHAYADLIGHMLNAHPNEPVEL